MGLFSSSKKSTSNTTITTVHDDDIVTSLDGDLDADESSVTQLSGIRGGRFNIQSTDHGAVEKSLAVANQSSSRAIGFGESALDFVGDSFAEALGFGAKALETLDDSTDDVISAVTGSAQSAIQAVSENNRTETDKLFEQVSKLAMWGIGAVSLIMVVMAWRRG